MEKVLDTKKEEMSTKQKRIYYLDILKIISCIAVVFLHVADQNINLYNPSNFEWQVFNFFDSISRSSVPIFVMISGALFLGKEKFDIKNLYKKNILRLFIAYSFYTLFYAFFNYAIQNKSIKLDEILKSAVLASNYHLWFIPMLICIYMSIPILSKIAKNSSKKEFEYIFILFFIFVILKTTIISFHYKYFDAIFDRFSILVVGEYIGYFLLGHYLNKYDFEKNKRIIFYILGIASLILCIIGNSIYTSFLNKPTNIFYNNFFITTFFESIAIFVFVKNFISKIKLNNIISKIIINISNASFGIYLIHVFSICAFTLGFNIYQSSFNPILSVPFISICAFLISYIITSIIKKIPVIGKYLT